MQHGETSTVQLENYDPIIIKEMCFDESHNWKTAIEGYRLFRRDRQGSRVRVISFCVKKWIDSEELPVRNSHKQVESLWIKIKEQTNKGHLVVGVCYRPPDQGEPADKAFLLQLQEASHSQALIPMGDLNHPNVCWGRHATQQAVINPGDSWSTSRKTLRPRYWTKQ